MNKNIYEQAEQFGIENRMLQCTEEAGELIQALCKYQRVLSGDKTCNTDIVHADYMVAEEIADVEICLEQIEHLLRNTKTVERIKTLKLERTEQRLQKEKQTMEDEQLEKIKVTSAKIITRGTTERPYFLIKYYDIADKEWYIGYSSYYLEHVQQWLDECFEIVE